MAGKFVLKRSGDQFMFNLQAANGQVVLSSERYASKQSAQGGITSVQRNAGSDERYELNPAGTHFTLKATNGEVIGSSESYSSPGAAREGIQAVKRAATEATVDDQTG